MKKQKKVKTRIAKQAKKSAVKGRRAAAPQPRREAAPAVGSIKPNPEFEQALKDLPTEQQPGTKPEAEPKKDRRGGARPGSGRPRGVTDDFALVNRLPEKANLTLVPVLKIPFEIWSQSQELSELQLKTNEAEDLALPITQLLEFYFPGKIPEIAWVWLMFFASIHNILEPRLKLLSKLRREKVRRSDFAEPAEQEPSNSPPLGSRPVVPGQPLNNYPKNE